MFAGLYAIITGFSPIICRILRRFFRHKYKTLNIVESPLETLINSEKLTLLDFHASWCGPCRAMLPVLDALEADFDGQLHIQKIDVDEHTDLAVQMRVMGVPTFMLFQHGKELWRHPGVFSKEALKQMIEAVKS